MPQVTARELLAFLRAQGFHEMRQSGSHVTLWHAERNLTLTLPGFSLDDFLRRR